MPVFRIPDRHLFPDPALANPQGLLGVGGGLEPERVLRAYRNGIFPWYSEGQPVLWWSPDPRMVLFADELHVRRSLGKIVRRGDFTVTADQAFERVIEACRTVERPGQQGTWITPAMREAYIALHEQGHAHSFEAWNRDGELAGGLYGVVVGQVFSGESMFTWDSNSSKVAFVQFVRQWRRWGFRLIDCQVHTPHLERFGAREIPRSKFLGLLRDLRDEPVPPTPWRLDPDLADPGGVHRTAADDDSDPAMQTGSQPS